MPIAADSESQPEADLKNVAAMSKYTRTPSLPIRPCTAPRMFDGAPSQRSILYERVARIGWGGRSLEQRGGGNSDTGSLPRILVGQGAWMTLTGFVSDELHYQRELMMSANVGRSWRLIRRCWCCSQPSKESALPPANEHEEFRKLQASGLKPRMIEFRKLKWMNRLNGR